MEVPDSPAVDDEEFDALAAASLAVVLSPYGSLSLEALEARHAGRPVLAQGRCDVQARDDPGARARGYLRP